jgi:hypothetical protein
MAAHLIRVGYFADYANPALRLLPEWTEWCIEQIELDGDAAARSREAASSAASVLIDAEDDEPAAEDDRAPFRRHEWIARGRALRDDHPMTTRRWRSAPVPGLVATARRCPGSRSRITWS